MLSQEKIGKFIADRRSMPDNSILLELCQVLDINVNELLSGEKLYDDIDERKTK